MESLPAVEKRAGVELGLEHPKAARVIVVSPAELGRPRRPRRLPIAPRRADRELNPCAREEGPRPS